jgi:DNA-binding HxlR family transcriptional regulator
MKFPDKARGSNTGRPIMVMFDLLGKKWSLRILWELHQEALNFRNLQSRCDQVSPTVLNNRLKELREFDLVEHQKDGYSLTQLGKELSEHLIALDLWANNWKKHF